MRKTLKAISIMMLLAGFAIVCISSGARSPQQSTANPATPAQAASSSQEPALNQTPAIRASSDLVRIDVEVTDKSGKPVKGLTPGQFSITENGKAQKISIFTFQDIEKMETAQSDDAKPIVVAIDSPNTPAAAEAIGDQVRDRRILVLFFDLTSMQTDDIARAHDAALKFVQKQMTSADLVSIVTYAARLTVWADFTNNRATLEKAVARLTPDVASELADLSYAAAQNGEYDVQQYTGAAYTADETEFNAFNTDQKLLAVQGLVNVLAAIPGRKAVIEFTGGITQTGEENRTELRAATDAANRADVSIYSIDARGLFAEVPGGDATTNAATGTSMFTGASVFHQTDARQDSRDTLATLSSDTGGHAFFDLGDLSEAFPKIQQDNSGYYLLGYYLGGNVKRDGTWRSIRVKVDAPGVHVHYRNGYYAPRDFQHLQKEDRQQQLVEAMGSENPVVELPIAVETSMFRLSNGQTYVPIAAKISSTALDWAEKHGRKEAAFDFAAQVRAYPNGSSVAELQDTIQVHLDTERYQQINQSSLVYQGGVVLSPGKYHLKFLARENESGRMGTFEQDLLVPQLPADRIMLSSVLLSSQLVPVDKSSEVETRAKGVRAKLTESPLEMSGEKIVPSVTRYFTQGQTLYVFFQAYYPEKSDKTGKFDPGTLRAALIFFRNGIQVNATPLLTPVQVDPKSRTASFRISLPLAKLPAGRYTAQALVIAAGTQHSAFGRAYLAIDRPPAVPSVTPAPSTPDSTPQAKPPSP
ncbi:MAG TPA: VWA domain-containing protein [Candidatus Acidoferrales bacterium]